LEHLDDTVFLEREESLLSRFGIQIYTDLVVDDHSPDIVGYFECLDNGDPSLISASIALIASHRLRNFSVKREIEFRIEIRHFLERIFDFGLLTVIRVSFRSAIRTDSSDQSLRDNQIQGWRQHVRFYFHARQSWN